MEVWQKIILMLMIAIFSAGIFIVEFPFANDYLINLLPILPIVALVGIIFVLVKGE